MTTTMNPRPKSKTRPDSVQLMREIRKEFPQFRIVEKRRSVLMHGINAILLVLTLGQLRTFMSQFTTTLGSAVYVPSSWDAISDESRCVILRHERVHLEQARRYGKLAFSLRYLFCWPAIKTERARFEREAYEESLRAMAEYFGVSHIERSSTRQWLVDTFTGPAYFWMWPEPIAVMAWYEVTVARIARETAP